MDPLQLYHLLRRRWLVVVFGTVVGASLAFASSLLDDQTTGPATTYWTAGQVLVLTDDDAELDLVRAATVAVVGDVPAAVASDLGVDLETLGLQAVTNAGRGTIAISAVGTDANEALTSAVAVAAGYLAHLGEEAENDHLQAVTVARDRVVERRLSVNLTQAEVDRITRATAGEDELNPVQADRLSRASVARDTASISYAAALTELTELTEAGADEPPLEVLQNVRALRISPGEFQNRIERAEQALNVFGPAEERAAGFSAAKASPLRNPVIRAIAGAIAGFILALMGLLLHAQLDTRLRSREAVEAAFGLPVLAEVPVIARRDQRNNVLHATASPYSKVTEAHRYLRSVLLFSQVVQEQSPDQPSVLRLDRPDDVRVIMVTSAGAGEGKTTTAANLAVMMAEAGYDTVLMNCDHRRPRLHELFGVAYAPETVTATHVENLQLITDVRRNEGDSPAQLSERQRVIIATAREVVDLVILDTAPVLATNDALDLLSSTDLVVLVAREGQTTVAGAAEAHELLIDRMGVSVAGVVVTAAGSSTGDRYYERYRYGSYYRQRAGRLKSPRGSRRRPLAAPMPAAASVPMAPPIAPAPVSYVAPLEAPVAYVAPLEAPVSYGVPLEAPVSYAVPLETPVAYVAPLETPVAYGVPLEAPVSYGVPLEAPVGYVAPLEAPVGYVAPLEAPVGYVAPLEAPVGYVAPLEAPVAYAVPLEAPVGYVEPLEPLVPHGIGFDPAEADASWLPRSPTPIAPRSQVELGPPPEGAAIDGEPLWITELVRVDAEAPRANGSAAAVEPEPLSPVPDPTPPVETADDDTVIDLRSGTIFRTRP